MTICVLTSSRADFGIYLPLLKKIQNDRFFDLRILAFGTHLSETHGKTITQIIENGFIVDYSIETLPENDTPEGIAAAMGRTTTLFAGFWAKEKFDLVLCLGDRYEMFAAVMAGVPFQIPFAHLHGGETTLGAIDNIFRHSITLASKYHFAATEESAKRIKKLTNKEQHVYHVGALSLDNIGGIPLLTISEFRDRWNIDLTRKTILTTFHPETVSLHENANHVEQLIQTIEELLDYQVLITMPNADTFGNIIRTELIKAFTGSSRVFLIENLGSQGYFTAMKYSSFLLGNTSSGIIEAASFNKYVIDLGDRQKGRFCGENVIHVPIKTAEIQKAVNKIENSQQEISGNCYYNGGAANKIIEVLKNIYNPAT